MQLEIEIKEEYCGDETSKRLILESIEKHPNKVRLMVNDKERSSAISIDLFIDDLRKALEKIAL